LSAALDIVGLTKVYEMRRRPSVVALDDVSLRVEHGQSVGLVGESGSGKSTLARVVLGMESASRGTVTLDTRVVGRRRSTSLRRELARTVQMVFQDPFSSLDPPQTIGGMLVEMHRFHFGPAKDGGGYKHEVADLLSSVGLNPGLAKVRPRSLSGGQRQRAAIARALAPNPKLLVLDEAVSALDVSVQAQVLNLLASIRAQRDLAILFISHDLSVIRQVCDFVYVLRHGRMVETGDVDSVLDHPAHPYTQMLRAAVPTEDWRPEDVAMEPVEEAQAAGDEPEPDSMLGVRPT
jgi:ABC-type oligopeptide transport system ATPase subunit